MSNADKTLIITATYNEIENLPKLVEEIFRYVPEAHLLVIDDNSPDGTGRWVDELATRDARVHALHRKGKLGLGTAVIAGLNYGLEHGYRYVLNMDADFSHHPRYLPELIKAMDPPGEPAVDLAIGSRYIPGGGVENWPLKRKLMSRGVNIYTRWLLWVNPKDVSGGYRCYRAAKLAGLDFAGFYSTGYSFQEEMLWRLKMLGARFAEVPIVFVDRVAGQSKIHMGEAYRALWIIARLSIKNWFGV